MDLKVERYKKKKSKEEKVDAVDKKGKCFLVVKGNLWRLEFIGLILKIHLYSKALVFFYILF